MASQSGANRDSCLARRRDPVRHAPAPGNRKPAVHHAAGVSCSNILGAPAWRNIPRRSLFLGGSNTPTPPAGCIVAAQCRRGNDSRRRLRRVGRESWRLPFGNAGLLTGRLQGALRQSGDWRAQMVAIGRLACPVGASQRHERFLGLVAETAAWARGGSREWAGLSGASGGIAAAGRSPRLKLLGGPRATERVSFSLTHQRTWFVQVARLSR